MGMDVSSHADRIRQLVRAYNAIAVNSDIYD